MLNLKLRGLTPISGLSSERGAPGLSANSSSASALGGIASNLGISGRGIRGSSIDRGRGRTRGGLYHSSLGNYQRSGFLYNDDDSRGISSARVYLFEKKTKNIVVF